MNDDELIVDPEQPRPITLDDVVPAGVSPEFNWAIGKGGDNNPGAFRYGTGNRAVFNAPLGSSPEEVAVRAHAYGEAVLLDKITPLREIAKAHPTKKWHVQTVIDHYVNHWLAERGVEEIRNLDIQPVPTGDPEFDSLAIPIEMMIRGRVLKPGIVSRIRNWVQEVWEGRPERDKLTKAVDKVGDLIERGELGKAVRILSKMVRYPGQTKKPSHTTSASGAAPPPTEQPAPPPPPKPAPEGEPNRQQEQLQQKLQVRAEPTKLDQEIGKMEQELPKNIPISVIHDTSIVTTNIMGDTVYGYDPPLWPVPVMVYPTLTDSVHKKPVRHTRHQPYFYGGMVNPSRLLPQTGGDGMGFKLKLSKKEDAAILIDCSGSMKPSFSNITSLLAALPRATIAVYGLREVLEEFPRDWWNERTRIVGTPEFKTSKWHVPLHEIQLVVVARGGNQLPTTHPVWHAIGCENTIDLPALEWLSRQKGRKMWISDGGVGCGSLSTCSPLARAMCAWQCVKGKIGMVRVENLNDLALLKHVKKMPGKPNAMGLSWVKSHSERIKYAVRHGQTLD